MSKFLKISAAFVGSFILSATAIFAQSTIEEVIVTAQRTEQSLQVSSNCGICLYR